MIERETFETKKWRKERKRLQFLIHKCCLVDHSFVQQHLSYHDKLDTMLVQEVYICERQT